MTVLANPTSDSRIRSLLSQKYLLIRSSCVAEQREADSRASHPGERSGLSQE